MSASDFSRSLARVLVYEGGKCDNPRDPGGRTNQGVTQRTYSAYLRSLGKSSADVYTMPDLDRDTIYRKSYWDAIRGDDLEPGLDLVVFDAAVNSGVGQAVKWLQQALVASGHYDGSVDGLIGDKTLQAITDSGDPDTLIGEVCSRRLATLQRLSTWKTFGRGWAARIANVQKTANSWNDNAPIPQAIDVTGLGGHQKAPVGGNLRPAPVSQIATQVATAASTAGTVATTAAGQVQSLGDTFSWLKYAFAGLTIVGIGSGVLVKISNDAKDAAERGTAKAVVDLDADAGLPSLPEPVVNDPTKAA